MSDLKKRQFGEMVTFFNRKVSEMDIPRKYKLELLGMITAIEVEHDMEMSERTAKVETVEKPNVFKCGECGQYFHSTSWGSPVDYCSHCGARLEWE